MARGERCLMLGKNQSVERAPNENFAPTACAMHALKDHFTTDVGLMSVECRGHRFHAGHECLLRALLSPSRAGRRRQGGGIAALTIQPRLERTPDATASDTYLALTQAVSAELSSLGTSMPKVMKAFGHLGRAATAEGALDRKTQALIALPLSVAVRCDPCIGFHTQVPARLGATRQDVDETAGVAVYMGGGSSLMDAASAIKAFDEFTGTPKS
jgi:AhpD family alkylhydroperoxidase